MPTYEYRCQAGHETEARQSIDADPLERCPREDCEATAERQISLGGGLLTKKRSAGDGDLGCGGSSGFT